MDELEAALGPELVEHLALGDLFAADVNGELRWIVHHLSEWWYGPLIGPLFEESVLSGWQRYDPTQYVPPIA